MAGREGGQGPPRQPAHVSECGQASGDAGERSGGDDNRAGSWEAAAAHPQQSRGSGDGGAGTAFPVTERLRQCPRVTHRRAPWLAGLAPASVPAPCSTPSTGFVWVDSRQNWD